MVLPDVAAGSSEAMNECLARYGGLVWSLARSLSPTHEDAEEAVQEIFLDVWRNAGRFAPHLSSEATFVAMIARRRLIDRRRRRQARVQPGPLPTGLATVPDSGPFRADHCDDVEFVNRLLDELRPQERTVLVLAIGEGRTHLEISETLEIPLGTVKSLVRRSLIRLQSLVRAAAIPESPCQPSSGRTPS